MSGTMECRACDGTGWVEGGTAIRTPCGRCGGLGVLSDLVHRPAPVSPDTLDKGLDFDLRTALSVHEPLCEVGFCDTCDAYTAISAQHLAALEGARKEVERELAGATDETVNRRVAKLLYDLDHGLDAPWWDEATDEERERYLARARKVEPIVNAYWRSRFDASQQEIERLTAERENLVELANLKGDEVTGIALELHRLTADHAALRTVVREWQEARRAVKAHEFGHAFDFGGDPEGDALLKAERDALAALAALGGGNE